MDYLEVFNRNRDHLEDQICEEVQDSISDCIDAALEQYKNTELKYNLSHSEDREDFIAAFSEKYILREIGQRADAILHGFFVHYCPVTSEDYDLMELEDFRDHSFTKEAIQSVIVEYDLDHLDLSDLDLI